MLLVQAKTTAQQAIRRAIEQYKPGGHLKPKRQRLLQSKIADRLVAQDAFNEEIDEAQCESLISGIANVLIPFFTPSKNPLNRGKVTMGDVHEKELATHPALEAAIDRGIENGFASVHSATQRAT